MTKTTFSLGMVVGCIIFLAIIFIVDSDDQIHTKPSYSCYVWVFDYRQLGRQQYNVMCGTDSIITKKGEKIPLPSNLKQLKDEISYQYSLIQKQRNRVD